MLSFLENLKKSVVFTTELVISCLKCMWLPGPQKSNVATFSQFLIIGIMLL